VTVAIWFGWFMVFNATFNNILVILWWSVLLVEETGVPGKKLPTCCKSLLPSASFVRFYTTAKKKIVVVLCYRAVVIVRL
jgi:hypothetical protein